MLHLDCLRLIASAGIVFLHLRKNLAVGGVWWVHANVSIDNLHLFVDLFFVISGYVISFVYVGRMSSVYDYGAFLKKRLARLVPLHWATFAAYLVIGLASAYYGISSANPGRFDANCIVPNLLLLHATSLCHQLTFNEPSWSISAEFIMYLFVPVVFLIHRWKWWIGGLAVVLAFSAISLCSWPQVEWHALTAPYGAIRAAPSFILGAFFYRIRDALAKIPYSEAIALGGLVAFVAGIFMDLSPYVLLLLLYVVAAAGIAADMQQQARRLVRIAAAGGQLTYSSYMLHGLIITTVVSFGAEHLLHLSGTAINVVVAASFLLVWPISYLSLMVFERPARHFVSHLGEPAQRGQDVPGSRAA